MTGDSRGGTHDRLRRGEALGLLTRDEADTLESAFDHVYELLLKRDLTSISTGVASTTYVDPRELDTLTRRHLRETFRSIASVQEAVSGDWRARVSR